MRGRKPKPTVVKELEGNPGKRPLNKDEPKPAGELKAAPSWFSADQKIIWKNSLKNAPKGLLKPVDEAVLANYCVSYDTYQKAVQELATRGSVGLDLKGERRVAPEIVVMTKMSTLIARYCSLLGFDPSSRSRIHLENDEDPESPFAGL